MDNNIEIFNLDNLIVLKEKLHHKKFKIIYLDPPYNTKNQFAYSDNYEESEYEKMLDERISLIKNNHLLEKQGSVIVSISEESLFVVLKILKKYFNYVYPPFVWLTKSILNQNKINTVNSVVHEYVIVASNEKITSHLEEIDDENVLSQKYQNYPLEFLFLNYPQEIKNNDKSYLKFHSNDYQIIKWQDSLNLDSCDSFQLNNNKKLIKKHKDILIFLKEKYHLNFEEQIFQKRTMQKNHGSERYYQNLLKLKEFEEDSLFVLLNVKDKSQLNGKCLLNNNYFQSIKKDNIKMKIPSFLGYYQPGITNFQTAKPVKLMQRLIKAFSNENDLILDLFSGSGNVLVAAHKENRQIIGVEISSENNIIFDTMKKNLNKNNINFEILK